MPAPFAGGASWVVAVFEAGALLLGVLAGTAAGVAARAEFFEPFFSGVATVPAFLFSLVVLESALA
jgi:hypothetical protein